MLSVIETPVTASEEPLTRAANALAAGTTPVLRPDTASVSVSARCVPAASVADEEYAGAVVSNVKLLVEVPAFAAASVEVMSTSYCWPSAKVTELTSADQVENAVPVFEAVKTVAVPLVPVKLLPFQ